MLRTFCKMLKIEGKLSIRDMNMIVFAIVMPVIVLAMIGIFVEINQILEVMGICF